jgi:hypothetical protein
MGILRKRVLGLSSIVGVLLASAVVVGCAKAPEVLNEEELFKLLVVAAQQGPLNFREKAWPLLEKKMITYCGQLDEVRVVSDSSFLLVKVDKTYAGEKLPWSLEGKADSPDLSQSYKTGDSICMTGIIGGYTERENQYRGYVQIVSVEKSAAQ